jgi:hypothetical protein
MPDQEPEGTEYLNRYRCPECEHEWSDVYDSQPDDDCPNCGENHISPYSSTELDEEEPSEINCLRGIVQSWDTGGGIGEHIEGARMLVQGWDDMQEAAGKGVSRG